MNIRFLTIAGALAAAAVVPHAAAAAPNDWRGYGNGSYGNNAPYGGLQRVSGIIASVNGGAITLEDGRTVFLKSDTSIAGGQVLRAGERIYVTGTDAGNGNLNARTIAVANPNGYGGGGYGNNGYPNDGYGRYDSENRDDRRRHHKHKDHHHGEHGGEHGDREDD